MGKVNNDLSVARLLELQEALQTRIAVDVQRAIGEFQQAAGFTPSAVDVRLAAAHRMDQELPDYLVDQVRARMDHVIG